MIQLPVQLHSLPIQAILISNGMIGFTKLGSFKTIFDHNNEVIISEEKLVVFGEEIVYNHGYVPSENLKKWLRSLELDNPFVEDYE